MKPAINVVTRFSRKENIEKCLNSLYKQTYNNIHHIITYETDELRKYLETKVNHSITTMIRVPNLERVQGLCRFYNHHDRALNYLNPDREFMNLKTSTDGKDPSPNENIPVEPQKYWGGNWWCMDLPNSIRVREPHFPYNQYIKIAEKAYKKGWVVFLDDDDQWVDENSLKNIVNHINQHKEDTVHIWRFNTINSGIKPHDNYWNYSCSKYCCQSNNRIPCCHSCYC